jgi:hypothetical protein
VTVVTNNTKQYPNVESLHSNSQFDIGQCFTKLQNYDKRVLPVNSFQLSPKSPSSEQFYWRNDQTYLNDQVRNLRYMYEENMDTMTYFKDIIVN